MLKVEEALAVQMVKKVAAAAGTELLTNLVAVAVEDVVCLPPHSDEHIMNN